MRVPIFLLLASTCASVTLAGPLPDAPVAKTVPFEETVQGIKVSDPYRWMESGYATYTPWLKAQADAAGKWLEALPMRAKLLAGIEQRSGAIAGVGNIQQGGKHVFIQRREPGAQTARLVVRDGLGGTDRVLFDPATLDTATAKGNSINYWEASPTGTHIYLGFSPGGSEESTMRIVEVASGKAVDGDISLALFNGGSESGGLYPQWLPDGSGFFYNRLSEGAKAGTPGYYLNTRLFFHKLGTPVASDRLIVARGAPRSPEMLDLEGPTATIQPGSTQVILGISDGVGRAQRLYVAPVVDAVARTATWRPIGSRADRILGATFLGNDLYLLRLDRPRGRVVVLRGGETDLAKAVEVVPEGPSPLESIMATADGIYIAGRGASGTELRMLDRNGSIAPVVLPFPGASYIFSGNAGQSGLFVSLENYVTPRRRLLVKGLVATDTGLGALPPFPVDAYVMESVLVSARDGTKVPLDIVRRKDAPKDGRRPVLLDAYGAYGVNVDPFFNPRLYAFLDAGGVYASAHVRGGGEFGRDWWLAGKEATKPNTWRDAIDSAEWLLKSGWTSGKRITLWGTSAGGIMVGRSITERPELWAGGIASVGIMNPMRFEFGPNGKTNIAEFGTVATPAGAKALHAMDAYHAIRPGTAYPPMLITAGANDPRVIDWQPAKFAAHLQAVGKGGPFVFDVDFDQGHGIGSMRSQLDQKAAEVGAFTLWAADQAGK